MSRKKHKIRSPRDTLQKTCAISHLFRVDGSLQRETSRLSMKADGNRKHINKTR